MVALNGGGHLDGFDHGVGSVLHRLDGGAARRRHQRGGDMVGHLLVRLVKLHTHDAADPLLLHGDAIEDVRHRDGAFVVSDDDELRMNQEPLQDANEPVDV